MSRLLASCQRLKFGSKFTKVEVDVKKIPQIYFAPENAAMPLKWIDFDAKIYCFKSSCDIYRVLEIM